MNISNMELLDNRKKFIWILILIVVSGSPALNNSTAVRYVVPITAFVSIIYSFSGWDRNFIFKLGSMLMCFVCIFYAQYYEFGVLEPAYFSLALKIIIGATIASILKEKFVQIFVEAMYYISIVSIIFYVMQLIIGPDNFPSVVNTFAPAENQKSIFIHTVVVNDYMRNASLFWEPGAFQGFIIIALALATLSKLMAYKDGRIRLYVLCFALGTTQSTAGIIVFFAVILIEIFMSQISTDKKIIILLIACFGGFMAFFELDFLGEKIQQQINDTSDLSEFYGDRFRAFLLDEKYIYDRPLTGNGFIEDIRWRFHPDFMGRNLGHGNGFSGFIANTGLIGFLAFVVGILTTQQPFNKMERKIGFLVIIILLLQSQHFLNHPFFWALCFISGKANHINSKA